MKLLNFAKKHKTLLLTICFMMIATQAFAAEPKIVSGSKTLLTDMLKWVLILVPVAGGLAIGLAKLQTIMSGNEPQVVSKNDSFIKKIIVSVIIAETGAGLITAIVAYYA